MKGDQFVPKNPPRACCANGANLGPFTLHNPAGPTTFTPATVSIGQGVAVTVGFRRCTVCLSRHFYSYPSSEDQ